MVHRFTDRAIAIRIAANAGGVAARFLLLT